MAAEDKHDEVTALEYGTLKVLYELLNRKFRKNQKSVDQQYFLMKNTETFLKGAQIMEVPSQAVAEEFSLAVDRYRKFVNSLSESLEEERTAAEALKAKADYLQEGTSEDPLVVSVFKKQRTNRFIIDHLLRGGYFETAQKLAEYVDADNCTKNVFHVAKQVEDALKNEDLTICSNWVVENRSRLHRLQSNFETEVRVQELIEKIKSGERKEAISFLRKNFSNKVRWENSNLLHVMGLLGFGKDTEIDLYKKLMKTERWEQILDMFRMENSRIFKLANQSAFSACLQVGISAHKTPLCRENRDSRCIICEGLMDLARDLPFANVKQSRLICAYNGLPLNDENRPYMLPNGYVYGEHSMKELIQDGIIECPRTQQEYQKESLKRIYVL